MAVFKFRAVFDGEIDCVRDIEIKSNQTFLDLHNALLSAINFQPGELASFYEADEQWRKGREISLEDMGEYDESFGKEKPLVMAKCKLQDHIENPRARFIWVYDFLKMWTFAIELIKIIPKEDPTVQYPRLVKSEGEPPKQFQNRNLIPLDEDFDDDTPQSKKSSLSDLGGVETYDDGFNYGDNFEFENNFEDESEFDEFSGDTFNDDNYDDNY